VGIYIIFYGNDHFGYFGWHKGYRAHQYYEGRYEGRHDTILLTSFYDDVHPTYMANFLIKDTSRLLVIHPYKEGGKVLEMIPMKLRPDNKGLMRGM
jgi:hypothetical protein